MSILDVFCSVDAFWQAFEPLWEREQVAQGRRRRRATRVHLSEIMTILILFQHSGYSDRELNLLVVEYCLSRTGGERRFET